jgi:hypothetical protein
MNYFIANKKPMLYNMFGYTTVREASIRNIKVGLTYRMVQVIILIYIIGYRYA